MADDITKRVNYFPRQFLHASDFKAEQDYHIDRRRRHNRMLHQPGVAEGLEVTPLKDDSNISIAAGTAINRSGEEIVVLADQIVPLRDFLPENATGNFDVYVVYTEQPGDPVDRELYPDVEGQTRFVETWSLVTTPKPRAFSYPPYKNAHWENEVLALHAVKVAKIHVKDGKLTEAPDNSVRERAGVRFGETLTLNKLTLTPDGAEGSGATLTCPDGHDATLTGGLRIEGDTPRDTGVRTEIKNLSEGPSNAAFVAMTNEVTAQFYAYGHQDGGGWFGTYTAHPVGLYTSNLERIRIEADGDIRFTGKIKSDISLEDDADRDTGLRVEIKNLSEGPSNAAFVAMTNEVTAQFYAYGHQDGGGWFGTYTAHPVGLYTSNLERIHIDKDGNVGIGKNPEHRLDVKGGVRFESVEIGDFVIKSSVSLIPYSGPIPCLQVLRKDNKDLLMSIDILGNVEIKGYVTATNVK